MEGGQPFLFVSPSDLLSTRAEAMLVTFETQVVKPESPVRRKWLDGPTLSFQMIFFKVA